MRSGHCSACANSETTGFRSPTHVRCRMPSCSCLGHDQDVKDKAAALVEPARTLAGEVEMLALTASVLSSAAVGLDLPAEDALRLLHQLRSALSAIRDVEAVLVTHIYVTGEHGDVQVADLPMAKVVRRRDRKVWDGRGIARAVVDARMTERGFEVPSDPMDVADWLLEVLAVSYARVTQLRAMGLDPEEFCETTPGSLSVTFAD